MCQALSDTSHADGENDHPPVTDIEPYVSFQQLSVIELLSFSYSHAETTLQPKF